MRRFLSILEGPGKGSERPLDKSYMLLGRSSVADVQIEGDDLLVSRRHLELRIKDGAVFVKDISSKGSLLNGQRLKGEVSLNPGDILDLGHTKLRYEELDAAEEPSDQTQSKPATVIPADRTRVADDRTKVADDRTRLAASVAGGRAEEPNPDATHAAVEENTRMLAPAELPGWKSPTRQQANSRAVPWIAAILALALVGGAAWWFLRDETASSSAEGLEFKDSGTGVSLHFPADWSRTATKPDMAGFGIGKESGQDWARVHIYTDRNPQFSITGLRSGFAEYKEILKKQFKDLDYKGSVRRSVNDLELVYFGFETSDLEGVGLYSLNADSRIVIECFSPRKTHSQFEPAFDSILKSLHLASNEGQQYLDFPLPDANMKRMALASPAELAREVQEHERRAEGLLASRDVRPDNLFRSVQEYGQALQLATAPPQPLAAYPTLARGLQRATQLYNQAVDRQRFEIDRALRANEAKNAYWAANRLLQMVPDKTTSAHQQAYKIVRSLEAAK